MPTPWVTDRLRIMRDWWRAYDAVVWDRWLAVVFTGLAVVPVLSSMSPEFGDLPRRPMDVFGVFLVLAQTAPLAVRSRWPAACLAVAGVSTAIHEALGYAPEFGSVSVYIALYSVGAHQERFRRVVAVAASAVFMVLTTVVLALGSPDSLTDDLIFYLLLAACWTVGAFVRQRRVEEAERRRLAAVAATATERARIARELHDVVTHHVTAIVVQADATQLFVESPDRVTTTLSTICKTGRQALSELRYLLDVLEATGESATPRSPVEGTLRNLVEQIRTGGQPVDLVEDGDQSALPVAVGLAVYRVVQEGLTNAMKYAAGQQTVVRVAHRDGHVEVEVTNDASPVPLSVGARKELSGGRGLTGLRDRVGKLGGELMAEEEPDGRFRLRAVIPSEGQP
ncbi:sensor histidine kinase [Amycolatopsis pigmentata]|uniref:histidine kinase n=1 Tax=Amycolatopsis pigmentata TaxID=450801 RepID=A0ABW5FSL9_9PSEU